MPVLSSKVERHRGWLDVMARSGPGAAFRIRLPGPETMLASEARGKSQRGLYNDQPHYEQATQQHDESFSG